MHIKAPGVVFPFIARCRAPLFPSRPIWNPRGRHDEVLQYNSCIHVSYPRRYLLTLTGKHRPLTDRVLWKHHETYTYDRTIVYVYVEIMIYLNSQQPQPLATCVAMTIKQLLPVAHQQ
jgi:hypothetical protein